MRKVPRVFSFLVVLLSACASSEIRPVPIEASDACSFCKMSISQKQFAAEIIAEDEKVLKFDDIGCLLRYRERAGDQLKPAAIFVTDHDSRQWLRAQEAFFVKTELKTPMGSGIVAYADKSKAGEGSMKFEDLK